jgi:hypothetical protein
MDTMSPVAAKPRKTVPLEPAPEPLQFSLRFPDKRLAEAVDEWADRNRAQPSRNRAIIMLLEDAMMAAGLWPPPTP